MRGVDIMHTTVDVFMKYIFVNSWIMDFVILFGLFVFLGVPYPQEISTEYIFPWENRLELLGATAFYYIAKALVLAIYWELFLGIKIK